MTRQAVADLRALEGHTVGLALAGGDRIDDCELVSLPLRGLSTFWIFVGGEDVFVAADRVLAVWETRKPERPAA